MFVKVMPRKFKEFSLSMMLLFSCNKGNFYEITYILFFLRLGIVYLQETNH